MQLAKAREDICHYNYLQESKDLGQDVPYFHLTSTDVHTLLSHMHSAWEGLSSSVVTLYAHVKHKL